MMRKLVIECERELKPQKPKNHQIEVIHRVTVVFYGNIRNNEYFKRIKDKRRINEIKRS